MKAKAAGGKALVVALEAGGNARRKARAASPLGALFLPTWLAPMTVTGYWQVRLLMDLFGAPWQYCLIGPACLGLAALYCAMLAEQTVKAGHSALVLRASVVMYAAVDAASAAWYVEHESKPWQEAALVGFFAASAVWLWDRRSRLRYRQVLDAQGRLDKPLPHFRLLRWLLFFTETWWAFKVAVRDGITRNDEALARGREALAAHREAKAARKAAKAAARPARRGRHPEAPAKVREARPATPRPAHSRPRGKDEARQREARTGGGDVTDLSAHEAEDRRHLASMRREFASLNRAPKRDEVKALCRVSSNRADALIRRYREEASTASPASDDESERAQEA